MNSTNEPGKRRVSGAAKFSFGVVLPVLAFIGYQVALVGSSSGHGNWEGMGVAYGSIVIVPGLFVINIWIFPLQWQRRFTVFLAGLALPAVIGLVEYFWIYGTGTRRAINAAFVAPFLWIWMFVALLFAPLIVSVINFARKKART